LISSLISIFHLRFFIIFHFSFFILLPAICHYLLFADAFNRSTSSEMTNDKSKMENRRSDRDSLLF